MTAIWRHIYLLYKINQLSNHHCFDFFCRVTAIWRHIYLSYKINQFIQSSVFWFLLQSDSRLKAYSPIIQGKPVYPIIYVLISLAGWQPFEGNPIIYVLLCYHFSCRVTAIWKHIYQSHLKAYLLIIQDIPVNPIIYVLLCYHFSCRVTSIWKHIYQSYKINQFIQSSVFLLQSDSRLKAYSPIIQGKPIIQDKPVYPIFYVLISLAGWQPFEGIFTNYTR